MADHPSLNEERACDRGLASETTAFPWSKYWFTDGYTTLARSMETSSKFLLELFGGAKLVGSQPGASGNYYRHPLEKACLKIKPARRKSELRDGKQLILDNIV